MKNSLIKVMKGHFGGLTNSTNHFLITRCLKSSYRKIFTSQIRQCLNTCSLFTIRGIITHLIFPIILKSEKLKKMKNNSITAITWGQRVKKSISFHIDQYNLIPYHLKSESWHLRYNNITFIWF